MIGLFSHQRQRHDDVANDQDGKIRREIIRMDVAEAFATRCAGVCYGQIAPE